MSNINDIENRIKNYNKDTAPVAGFYKSQDKLFEIEGVGSVEAIFDSLCIAIEQLQD